MSQMTLPKGSYECEPRKHPLSQACLEAGRPVADAQPELMHCAMLCRACHPKKGHDKSRGRFQEQGRTNCARQALDVGPPHIDIGTNQCAYFLLYTIPSFAEICQEMRPESHRSEFKLSGQARQDSSSWGMMLPACRLPTHHASGFRNWSRTQTLHHCFP